MVFAACSFPRCLARIAFALRHSRASGGALSMRVLVLGVCVWLATAVAAFAQFDTATVLGTVRDSSDAIIPGAKVTLTGVETGISAVKMSGADGNYEFAAVRPGL